MPTEPNSSRGLFQSATQRLPGIRTRRNRGVTLVETMIALLIFSGCMLGFLGTFLQSRKTTEGSILHAAATNIVYGIIEQIKDLDYSTMLPCGISDPGDPNTTLPPTIRVQINQNTLKWLRVTYTKSTDSPNTPKAPLTTPLPGDSVPSGVVDNVIGPLPLSTATGTVSQSITIHLWVWIDEIPDLTRDVSDVKRVTVVYTYDLNTGSSIRTLRNREVFLRTHYQ